MKLIKNILMLVGIIAIASAAWYGPTGWKYYSAFKTFDPKAFATYKKMADQLVETGNAASATV
ncbi:hypothetical protein MNBD_ALPHA08-928, partial [hydrothermal vent metagenome]